MSHNEQFKKNCRHLQILAVDGVTLLNMSYDDALKLLQSTGATVELVLSQIFHQKASINSAEQEASKQKEEGSALIANFNRHQNDAPREERAAVAQTYQNSNQCQIKPKKMSEEAKNRCEYMATVKSGPDLPKVGLYDGQFNHPSHSTLETDFKISNPLNHISKSSVRCRVKNRKLILWDPFFPGGCNITQK